MACFLDCFHLTAGASPPPPVCVVPLSSLPIMYGCYFDVALEPLEWDHVYKEDHMMGY